MTRNFLHLLQIKMGPFNFSPKIAAYLYYTKPLANILEMFFSSRVRGVKLVRFITLFIGDFNVKVVTLALKLVFRLT